MQNKKGKITAMFLSSVLACTAMVSAITGTQVNGAYTKSTEWETQSVVTTASGKGAKSGYTYVCAAGERANIPQHGERKICKVSVLGPLQFFFLYACIFRAFPL